MKFNIHKQYTMIRWTQSAYDENGRSPTHFLYIPKKTGRKRPISKLWQYPKNFVWRDGQRWIKIKRFGKTKRYRTTKFIIYGFVLKPEPIITNPDWIYNMRMN